MFNKWNQVIISIQNNNFRYGNGISEVTRSNSERKGEVIVRPVDEGEFVFDDPNINDLKWKNSSENENIYNFFLANAVCHTVVIEESGKYSASSPDEAALVISAKHIGFEFIVRNDTPLTTFRIVAWIK